MKAYWLTMKDMTQGAVKEKITGVCGRKRSQTNGTKRYSEN